MKTRSVAVLAVIVAALGAFVWFYERRQPSPEERSVARRKLVDVSSEEVLELRIERPNRPTLRLERQALPAEGARWRLTEPRAHRADALAVDGLLRALTELERQRTITDAPASDVGLDDPRFRLTWRTAQGSETLLVGAAVPGSGEVLIGLGSQPGSFVVTSGSFVSELERDADAWRDRRLFPGERSAIAQVRITPPSGGTPVVLARRGESFQVLEPFQDQAERDLVEGLLGELTAASASGFAAAEEAFAPAASVDLTFSDGTSPYRLELGAATGPGDGAPVRVRASSGSDIDLANLITRLPTTLALPAERWRSRAWTSLASYDIQAVEVKDAGGSLRLERAGVDWTRGAEKVSYTEVSDFLAAITAAGASQLETGSDESGGTSLTILLEGPKEVRETLVLAGERATNSARPGMVLRLTTEDAEEVRRTLERLRASRPAAD
ncbi:MAG: DUF4340 domain-containing protein [Thermoanaerobaculia bacterium]|nr:DUF4340 domain-containing protein [Thermoanaerobaculia bacterium]